MVALGGMAGIAVLFLVTGLALKKRGYAPTIVVWLMFLTGIVGLGGFVGAMFARGVTGGVHGANAATAKAFGAGGVAGLAVLIVLSIFVIPHLHPKKSPPTKATWLLALLWGPVATAVGGVFALAVSKTNGVAAELVTQTMQFLTDAFQGL